MLRPSSLSDELNSRFDERSVACCCFGWPLHHQSLSSDTTMNLSPPSLPLTLPSTCLCTTTRTTTSVWWPVTVLETAHQRRSAWELVNTTCCDWWIVCNHNMIKFRILYIFNFWTWKINFKDDSTRGYMEGSKIFFYCRDGGSVIVAICMKNGSWSPDPHTYRCQKESMTLTTTIFPYNIKSYLPPGMSELNLNS